MKKKDTTKKVGISLLLAGAIIYLSFTPFYGIGYLIAILATASRFRILQALPTYLSQVVVSGLLLGASIMLAGLISWLLGTFVPPLLVIFIYLTIALLTTRKVTRSARVQFVDKGDVLSVVLALIAPAIILLSFGTSPAGMLEVAQEGWDNGSHVIMLQDASIYKGYLYGTTEDVGDKVIFYGSNYYPQAWHLASANVLNGFGSSNVFNPEKPIRTTYVYVATVALWLVVASYLFTRVSLFVANQFTRRKLQSAPAYLLFSVCNIFIQMIVLWGSFNSGFSNYIGMLAYLIVLIACLMNSSHKVAASIIGLIAGTAAVLCWFLPIPAILCTALLFFVVALGFTNRKKIFSKFNKNHLALIVGSVLMLAICLGQILIFLMFTDVTGADQLNEGVAINATDVVNGVFPVSQLLFVLIIAFTIGYWKKHHPENTLPVLLAVMPPFFLSIGIFVYQSVSAGYTSYYLSKSMGIALLIAGIFAVPAFTFWVLDFAKKYKLAAWGGAALGIFILSLVILATNQSFYGASRLLERNTRINHSTAQVLVDHLKTANHKSEDVIVMRLDPKKPYEDRNGRFEMRVIHRKLNCAYTVRNSGASLNEWLTRLENCANRQHKWGNTITVITSERTTKKVEDLSLPNVKVIEVK